MGSTPGGPAEPRFGLASAHDGQPVSSLLRPSAGTRRTLRALGLLLVIGLASSSLGCDESRMKTTAGHERSEGMCERRAVRMAVASSLREVALALIDDLAGGDEAIAVETSFGASSALARQLELGAPIDLIVSADAEIVETLGRSGAIDPGSQREIARGRLVLAAPIRSELPDQLRAALESPDFDRIALPAAAVPLGRYARAWLAGQGLLAERAELLGELAAAPAPAEPPATRAPARALRIFVSCAETSGETHAVGLVRRLRARLEECGAPAPELVGVGGERLRDAGVATLADPVSRASMGLDGALGNLPFYLDLLTRAAGALREPRADVCVAVDSPALHVPLGRLARSYDVPFVHFVTPQYWGWAPWRTAGYRSAVDRALTILPFEPGWFGRRHVPSVHVGHPLLDLLADVPSGRADEASPTLAVLAGSRRGVLDRNLPWMLGVVARVRRRHPELRIVLPHDDASLEGALREHVRAAGAESWARVEIGDLHGSLRGARAAFSVSGTILLDLLHHRLPTVVVYRLKNSVGTWAYRRLLTAPWFASINLLAGREVVPEFCFHGEGPGAEVSDALARCYNDPAWRRRCQAGLDLAARRLGPPGACDRAAAQVLACIPPPPP